MQAALERGPDWVKDHLNDQEIEQVSGISWKSRKCSSSAAVPAWPSLSRRNHRHRAAPVSAEGVPLPDRNPNREATAAVDAKPSQTLADSDKTPPSKAKATR